MQKSVKNNQKVRQKSVNHNRKGIKNKHIGSNFNDFLKEIDMEDELVLCKAMLKAKEAFDKYINKTCNLDGAYFSLYMTGYLHDTSFKKWKEVRMDINGTGYEKFQYPDKEDIGL